MSRFRSISHDYVILAFYRIALIFTELQFSNKSQIRCGENIRDNGVTQKVTCVESRSRFAHQIPYVASVYASYLEVSERSSSTW